MSWQRSNLVLDHINDAESWLSKAKTEYQAKNRPRGELDLCLAQAEVRFAWELSRDRKQAVSTTIRRPARRWWLPVAACLGIGLLTMAVLPRLFSIKEGAPAGRATDQARPGVIQANATGTHAPAPARVNRHTERSATNPAAKKTAAQANSPAGAAVPNAETNKEAASPAVPSADGELHAASADDGMIVDLGELAREAQETLMKDGASTQDQR